MSIIDKRSKKEPPELEITAFLNLMVILVPFLLITAVFSQITIINLNLPIPSEEEMKNKPDEETLQLEVIIRKDALEVADNKRGLLKRIPNTDEGFDYKTLTDTLKQIKSRFPDKTDVSILSEKKTTYNTLIQTMDAVRLFEVFSAGSVIQAELFPDMAIGDAPAPATNGKKK
jgi:biopolymer transport protein ExbD